ncbi:HU family DNA-binding protein [Halosquirtibacter xylanolyticus]|uniref:HU family DNA-binding protein n=1 Tax=Halosquirtibacter xylanolyticus TaxID=3374599 RepID=UPI003748D855|nr:HU family DNA-binding protein [Prolixibacteraceae bacterium]
MNKTELIKKVSEETGLTIKDTKKTVEAFLNATMETLKEEDRLIIAGFGSFYTIDREAREVRNPATGKPVKVEAKRIVRFKAGQDFGNKIN